MKTKLLNAVFMFCIVMLCGCTLDPVELDTPEESIEESEEISGTRNLEPRLKFSESTKIPGMLTYNPPLTGARFFTINTNYLFYFTPLAPSDGEIKSRFKHPEAENFVRTIGVRKVGELQYENIAASHSGGILSPYLNHVFSTPGKYEIRANISYEYLDHFTPLEGEVYDLKTITVTPPGVSSEHFLYDISVNGSKTAWLNETQEYTVTYGTSDMTPSIVWSIDGHEIISGQNTNTVSIKYLTAGQTQLKVTLTIADQIYSVTKNIIVLPNNGPGSSIWLVALPEGWGARPAGLLSQAITGTGNGIVGILDLMTAIAPGRLPIEVCRYPEYEISKMFHDYNSLSQQFPDIVFGAAFPDITSITIGGSWMVEIGDIQEYSLNYRPADMTPSIVWSIDGHEIISGQNTNTVNIKYLTAGQSQLKVMLTMGNKMYSATRNIKVLYNGHGTSIWLDAVPEGWDSRLAGIFIQAITATGNNATGLMQLMVATGTNNLPVEVCRYNPLEFSDMETDYNNLVQQFPDLVLRKSYQ